MTKKALFIGIKSRKVRSNHKRSLETHCNGRYKQCKQPLSVCFLFDLLVCFDSHSSSRNAHSMFYYILLPNLVSPSVVQLELMCMWWERFSSESEAFSQWINEKEKELEAVNPTSSLDPLDKHISSVLVCLLSHSFLQFHSLTLFFAP